MDVPEVGDARLLLTMFIELAEYLRCPSGHAETFLILVPDEMHGRDVRVGTLGCPTCGAEFAIDDGTVTMGAGHGAAMATGSVDADAVQALLDLSGPGGYVVTVGSAGSLASSLSERLTGVHVVTVNPPPTVRPAEQVTVVTGPGVPVRSNMARGVVVGAEVTGGDRESAGRILLRGRRLVTLAADAPRTSGLRSLASGLGLSVAEKI